jgi:hypothetical protein
MRGDAAMVGLRRRFSARAALRRWTFAAFFPLEMAREEKRFELKPVIDAEEAREPIIRLESEETLQRAKAARLDEPYDLPEVSRRLVLPTRAEFELRTHQPGIDALIETETTNPDQLEHTWDQNTTHHRHIPWGWFVLLALILASAAIWSLSGVQKAEVQADKLVADTQTALNDEAEEELKASQLIDRIETTIRSFFAENNVDARSRLVRHPERVRPLMETYYGTNPISANRHLRTKLLQSLTLDNRANFWMASVELEDHSSHNLILEIVDSGEPRIDWETLVCHQPLKWDSFVTERPAGTSFDFRVYVEPDNFFSHEFADSNRWSCFRLSALGSEEILFGYANANEELNQQLMAILNKNPDRKSSMILRLTIPEGLQSRRGVVIEKLVSPRWIYVDPPES